MHVLFTMCLVLLASLCSSASVIPAPETLPDKFKDFSSDLRTVYKRDSKEALLLTHGLFTERFSLSTPNRAWVQFQYAYLLLQNDSVSRAQHVLTDTLEFDVFLLDPNIQALQELGFGLIDLSHGNYDNADAFFRYSLQLATNKSLQIEIVQAYSDNLRYQGKLDLSFSGWLNALELSEGLVDSTEIAECWLGIGKVELLRGNLVNAESRFIDYEAFSYKSQNRKNIANAQSMLSLVACQRHELEKSIELALKSYGTYREIQYKKGQGESLSNLALGHMGLKNWSQALRYLEEAVILKVQVNDLTQMAVIHNNIGYCHRELGNTEEALTYFTVSLEKGKQNGQLRNAITSYQYLIQLFVDEKSDYKKAFSLQSELIELKDSLANTQRLQSIEELTIGYKTNQKEREIDLLRKEQSIKTNRWLTLALTLFFLIIVGVLIYDNQKRKHSQEKQLLSAEDELQKAELKIMTGLLEQNRQKLSLYTENLLKKNELVNRLEGKLKDAVGDVSDSEERESILNNVSGIRILTDEDWEEFKQLFNGVHRGMLERLLLRYQNLTLGEQRLFLLMKLSMSTKQVANILGVSPDSVKKARYRLKRKLELEEEVLLQDFINAF